MALNWETVFVEMRSLAGIRKAWQYGQEKTIRWAAKRLDKQAGVLVADEVGMGKTRVVMAAILAVVKNGGSVAAVVPPGLIYQWIKEWDDFLHDLTEKRKHKYNLAELAKFEPIQLRTYSSMFNYDHLQYPLLGKKNRGRWLLISHQFGTPNLQDNSPLNRYMLPLLAATVSKNGAKQDLNKVKEWKSLQRKGAWHKDCLNTKCADCPKRTRKSRACRFDIQVLKAAKFVSKEHLKIFNNLPDIRNVADAKAFYTSPDGHQMVKDLLGKIDLLVIDEAHKSRDTEKGRKVLGTLLHDILKTEKNTKRIALTATPMELRAGQWETIFKRIGEGPSYPEAAVRAFDEARDGANRQPDSAEKIRALIRASGNFSKALKPYVTRRRRTQQEQMREIVGPIPCENEAHPHRDNSEPIEIDFNDVSEDWKAAIFTMEALGKAAKGCSIKKAKELNRLIRTLKIIDIRYAAGKIAQGSAGPLEEDKADQDHAKLEIQQDEVYLLDQKIEKFLDNSKGIDSFIEGKLRRMQFWLQVQNAGHRKLEQHPRVQRTADEIEKFVWEENGKIKAKVLVFGTFVNPLRALREVLNSRAVLRILDRRKNGSKEPPLPGVAAVLSNLDTIWDEYVRLRKQPATSMPIKRRYTRESLKETIIEAGKRYEQLININLNKKISKSFARRLPRAAYIKKAQLNEKVIKLLKSYILSSMIFENRFMLEKKEKYKADAMSIWIEFFERATTLKGPEGDEVKFSSASMRKLIDDEIKEHVNQFGSFARILYGKVRMETRRILQAQFNNAGSFPIVLIAQSQVGREGLNLHKACRRIVQFNAEWNPGVNEQQIGRVDRIKSLWEAEALAYRERKGPAEPKDVKYPEEAPRIHIHPVLFKGTYDSFQHSVSKYRHENLKAHLFGELLSDEALEKVPSGKGWDTLRNELKKSAPDFSPMAAKRASKK